MVKKSVTISLINFLSRISSSVVIKVECIRKNHVGCISIGRNQRCFMLRHVIPSVIKELQKVRRGQEVCYNLLN